MSKAQKASQTTRFRKTYDTSVQVEDLSADAGKGGKPGAKKWVGKTICDFTTLTIKVF